MHTLLPQARSEDYMKKNIEKIICFSSCILHSCPDNALCFSSCIPHSCPDCACGSKVCIYIVLQVDDDQYLLQMNHSSCYCFSFFLDYQTFPEFQHTVMASLEKIGLLTNTVSSSKNSIIPVNDGFLC